MPCTHRVTFFEICEIKGYEWGNIWDVSKTFIQKSAHVGIFIFILNILSIQNVRGHDFPVSFSLYCHAFLWNLLVISRCLRDWILFFTLLLPKTRAFTLRCLIHNWRKETDWCISQGNRPRILFTVPISVKQSAHPVCLANQDRLLKEQ